MARILACLEAKGFEFFESILCRILLQQLGKAL